MKKEIDEMNADSEDEHYTFEEEELEALLEKVEQQAFLNEEEAIKFFEDHYKKLEAYRFRWCKRKVKPAKPSGHPID